MLWKRTVSGSAESGGATQAMVLGRRRPHRGRRRSEEHGREEHRTLAKLGGRRKPEQLEEATLAISFTLVFAALSRHAVESNPEAEEMDDVGGQHGATPPGIVRCTGAGLFWALRKPNV